MDNFKNQTYLTRKYRFAMFSLAIIMIVLDQWTKNIARHKIELYQIKFFNKFWDWTLIYNHGAAFNILSNQGGWQKILFVLIALIVAIGISYYILTKSYTKMSGIAFSLILSGALGNLIDRIYLGKVTDFIFWHIGPHYWPAFNIADSCVCVGAFLLIIEGLFLAKKND